jgi:predicted flap endonuclease-1-like 5' DNA nuclease
MMYLIAALWLPLLLSALLGLVIGGWIWRDPSRYASEELADYAPSSAPIIPPAPPEIKPEPEPEPEPAVELPVVEEPVAEALPEPALEPEPEPEPVHATSPFMAAPDGEPDNLTLIKGVGPKLSDMLHALGVYHFSQIAEWDADQVAEVDSQLGSFNGRVSRDRWVDQARMLADRNVAAFEREFGKMNGQL